MKKVLILGATGMAGHMVFRYLDSLNKYDLICTAREYVKNSNCFVVDIEQELDKLKNIIENEDLDIIINCIGLLIQDCEDDLSRALYVNSFFPRWLEYLTRSTKTKIIHISTDCVFDGNSITGYNEDSPTVIYNNYSKTKALGEINNNKDLTIRTSIIGPELKFSGSGLFNWFMKQNGSVNGYTNVYWNGVTTLELAKQLDRILNINLTGLYHLPTDKSISKYELLILIGSIFNRTDIVVQPAQYSKHVNKVLINNRKLDYNPEIPDYTEQLKDLLSFVNSKEYYN